MRETAEKQTGGTAASAREIQLGPRGPLRPPRIGAPCPFADRAAEIRPRSRAHFFPGGALATGSDQTTTRAFGRWPRNSLLFPARGVVRWSRGAYSRSRRERECWTGPSERRARPLSRGGPERRPSSRGGSGSTFQVLPSVGCDRIGRTPPRRGADGRRGASVAHPTRLETRTKESNTCASRRVDTNPWAQ